jgi:hypothetical protein
MFVPYIVSGIDRIYDDAFTLTVTSAAKTADDEHRKTPTRKMLNDLIDIEFIAATALKIPRV